MQIRLTAHERGRYASFASTTRRTSYHAPAPDRRTAGARARLAAPAAPAVGQILVQLGYVSEGRLLQACAVQKGVNAWHLQHSPPAPEALVLVPANLCRAHQLLPCASSPIACSSPCATRRDIDAIDMVRNIAKMRIEPVLASEERLLQTIEELSAGHCRRYGDATARLVSEALTRCRATRRREAGHRGRDAARRRPRQRDPAEAVRMRASDIHIEPRKGHMEIRFRVDGQLQRVHEIPVKLQAPLTARLKIMATLDIVECRLPRTGASPSAGGRPVDRPLDAAQYHGQRVVLRVLDNGMTLRKLKELGLSDHNLAFNDIIHQPYGLVLVTAPTGSGKTTTLYAAVNQVKLISNNIMTCEDPVEYDIDGVNQSHVNEKVGLTFAAQLRAILRQDPDIILVGEIRDQETAGDRPARRPDGPPGAVDPALQRRPEARSRA